LGTELSEDEVSGFLKRLQIPYKNGKVTAPSFRPDLEREIDVIEEVARLMNFDKIPTRPASNLPYDLPVNHLDRMLDILRAVVRELGFNEVITNSMIALRDIRGIGDREPVKILNPISDDMNVMRNSLIPGMLKVLSYNINRNMSDLRIFELGRVFGSGGSTELFSQEYKLGALVHGRRSQDAWDTDSLYIDFYDLKGIIETFADKIALDNLEFILYSNNVYFDSEQAVELRTGGDIIGYFGRLKETVCRRFDIETEVFGFEFDGEVLRKLMGIRHMYEPFSRFPYVEKDLAFVVDRDINAEQVYRVIEQTGKPLVSYIRVFDLYEGDRLPEDKKSLAFRIRFQSSERTLTDTEVNAVFQKIIKMVQEKLPATLRE
jgi:phenylalanyl-tRNA synthetase beta chain